MNRPTMNRRRFLATVAPAPWLASCQKRRDGSVIRFGHFPNITHVQALVAHQLTRRGEGWFEKHTGSTIEWLTFNAGPSATEAIFAGTLDFTYIGPSPTLNAYAKSKGTEMRVLAGAANGGSALLVRPEAGINSPADFRGKKVATPQLGNTQDVQARAWFASHGLKTTVTGGDLQVIPTQNADQLPLFQQGRLDAVWTVEPWVSRLELEANARVFLDDRETSSTLLAASARFLKEQPALARKVLEAHRALTEWILAHSEEAKSLVKTELEELTQTVPKDELIEQAWKRIVVTNDISRASLDRMVTAAQQVGFLKDIPDLSNLLPNL